MGRSQDHRTDVFAFGCVLFECLAGTFAFEGDTAEDVLAAVLSRDPRWEALPNGLPSPVRDLLARCLAKDPKKRLSGIADAPRAGGSPRRRTAPHSRAALRAGGSALVALAGHELRRARRRIGEVPEAPRRDATLDADGPGRLRKDASRPAARRGSARRLPRRRLVRGSRAPQGSGARRPGGGRCGRRARGPGTSPLETTARSAAEKTVLVVLDNCEHQMEPSAEIARTLLDACPRVTILATTRSPAGVRWAILCGPAAHHAGRRRGHPGSIAGSDRIRTPVSGARQAREPGVRHHGPECARRRDLPAPGRNPACDRARRIAHGRPLRRGDPGQVGSAIQASRHRGTGHSRTAPDAPRRDSMELRAAHARGAAALRALGVPGRLDVRVRRGRGWRRPGRVRGSGSVHATLDEVALRHGDVGGRGASLPLPRDDSGVRATNRPRPRARPDRCALGISTTSSHWRRKRRRS